MPAPVPERAPGEPAPVGLGLVLVPDDRGRDVPALPAGPHRAVLRGRCPRRRGGSPRRSRRARRASRGAGAGSRRASSRPRPARRAAARRGGSGGAGGRPCAAACGGRACRRRSGSAGATAAGAPSGKTIRGPATPQRGCACHEVGERRDGAGLGDGVGVRGERRASPVVAREAEVQVRRVAERALVLERLDARRHRARDVRDHDAARRPAARAPAATPRARARLPVRDDDGRDLHRASTCR